MAREAPVATECQLIQEALAEHGGDASLLDGRSRGHVQACPECCEVAAAERALGAIFRAALPPADPAIERSVVAAVRASRWRRRALAMVPVAA